MNRTIQKKKSFFLSSPMALVKVEDPGVQSPQVRHVGEGGPRIRKWKRWARSRSTGRSTCPRGRLAATPPPRTITWTTAFWGRQNSDWDIWFAFITSSAEDWVSSSCCAHQRIHHVEEVKRCDCSGFHTANGQPALQNNCRPTSIWGLKINA